MKKQLTGPISITFGKIRTSKLGLPGRNFGIIASLSHSSRQRPASMATATLVLLYATVFASAAYVPSSQHVFTNAESSASAILRRVTANPEHEWDVHAVLNAAQVGTHDHLHSYSSLFYRLLTLMCGMLPTTMSTFIYPGGPETPPHSAHTSFTIPTMCYLKNFYSQHSHLLPTGTSARFQTRPFMRHIALSRTFTHLRRSC